MNAQASSGGSGLTREQIVAALSALSTELKGRGVSGEVCLFGWTVMVLAYAARVRTKDVDALFEPASIIREVARDVAGEHGLPEQWLNDGVKGFLSSRHETTMGNLPQYANLRITMPVPEYLLAMKAMAGRIAVGQNDPSDVADIKFLVNHLGLKTAESVLDLVARYYPANRIPVKTQYLIEGLFEEGSK